MSLLDIEVIGSEILEKTLDPVSDFDEKLSRVAENMKESMVFYEGIGLAANQVGHNLRMFVVYEKLIDENKDFLVMVNPLIKASEGKSTFEEGCLSVPNIFSNVVRPSAVQVEYYDLKGKKRDMEANGYLARVIQHEYDHLNGILFVERLPKLKRKMLKPKLKKRFHLQ